MKIIITNTVVLNGGDAAILMAIVRQLQSVFGDRIVFEVFDSQPEAAAHYYPSYAFRPLTWNLLRKKRVYPRCLRRIWWRFEQWRFWCGLFLWAYRLRCFARILLRRCEVDNIKAIDNADLVVSTGGTYLVENYSLEPRIFEYRIARVLGKPLLHYTQSVGRLSKARNRSALLPLLRRSLRIFLRDDESMQSVIDLGVSAEKCEVCDDVVFSLYTDPVIRKEQVTEQANGLRVALSVRDWPFFVGVGRREGMDRYRLAVAAAVTQFVQHHDAHVTFLSTCQGISEYWLDDSRVAEEIRDILPDGVRRRVCVNRRFHSPERLLSEVGRYHCVVSTRMHLAIMSMMAHVPVLAISYEFKTTELFRKMQMDRWVHPIEELDPQKMKESVDAFVNALSTIRDSLMARVPHMAQSAMAPANFLRKWRDLNMVCVASDGTGTPPSTR